jgi:hypothetical protein
MGNVPPPRVSVPDDQIVTAQHNDYTGSES